MSSFAKSKTSEKTSAKTSKTSAKTSKTSAKTSKTYAKTSKKMTANNVQTKRMKFFHILLDMEELSESFSRTAYENAANVVFNMSDEVFESISSTSPHIAAIGSKTKAKIIEFLKTGCVAEHEILIRDAVAARELGKIMGAGATVVKKWIDSGILSVEDLRDAAYNGTVVLTVMQDLGLKYYTDLQKKIPRSDVLLIYGIIMENLRPFIKKATAATDSQPIAELVGSYRRGAAESGDVDILLCLPRDHLKNATSFIGNQLKHSSAFIAEVASGVAKISVLWRHNGIVRLVEIYVCEAAEYVPHLLYLTGSARHNRYLRFLCKKAGYKLSQHGLVSANSHVILKSEKSIYKFLKIEYVPPKQR